MRVSGLVVTVSADEETRERLVESLRVQESFLVGEWIGPRLTVALTTTDGTAAEHWHGWLEAQPGVVKVDVAFVSFEDAEHVC